MNKRMRHTWMIAGMFSVVLLAASCETASPPAPTPEEREEQLLAERHVRIATEYRTEYRLGVAQTEEVSRVRTFDRSGHLTAEAEYRTDGTLDRTFRYEYDAAGRLRQMTAHGADSSLLYKVNRSYDENGRLSELYFNLPDGTYKYRNLATYDKKGRMTDFAWYWPTGLKAINRYSYNGYLKTRDTEFSPGGRMNYVRTFSYDADNRLIRTVHTDSTGKELRATSYMYRGPALDQEVLFSQDGVEKSTRYQYQPDGLPLSRSEYDRRGQLTVTFRYVYVAW